MLPYRTDSLAQEKSPDGRRAGETPDVSPGNAKRGTISGRPGGSESKRETTTGRRRRHDLI
jgi:hypothetical protein